MPISAPSSSRPHAAPRGLIYVTDDVPGISRRRSGKSFAYRQPDGRPVRAAHELARIRSLAIPPAYTGVWICRQANGHLQATGRDARGRKQYRYHVGWRSARSQGKFARMLAFGAALPRIRAQVERDLHHPSIHPLRRETVLATLVRLLDTTLIRVGNDEYARSNGSYGLTTLRNRHAHVSGGRLQFHFKGKSGIEHRVALHDPRVARVVRACRELPGQELFQCVDDNGSIHHIASGDVNDYLRAAGGMEFSAKDFRTWHASAQALALLATAEHDASERDAIPRKSDPLKAAKQQVKAALTTVASKLGNTVAVCRSSYVHPQLLAHATDGTLPQLVARRTTKQAGLTRDECRLMWFLHAVEPTPHVTHRRSA